MPAGLWGAALTHDNIINSYFSRRANYMTLIARFFDRETIVYLGDILLSSKEEPLHSVSIPTADDINALMRPAAPPTFVVGTVQKVNLVNDRLLFAWAGSYEQARSICQSLSSALEGGLAPENIQDFILRERPSFRDGVSLLGTAINIEGDTLRVHNFSYRSYRMGVPELRGDVAGTGSKSFVSLLTDMTQGANAVRAVNQGQNILNLGMSTSGVLTGNDMAFAAGIVAGWGGGFELAILSDKKKFKKISNIIHVPWEIVKNEQGLLILQMVPRIARYAYHGSNLIVKVLDLQKPDVADLAIHVVRPLLAETEYIEPTPEPMHDFSYATLQCHIRLPNGHVIQATFADAQGLNQINVKNVDGITKLSISPLLFGSIAEKVTKIFGQPVYG
ncbi:hypothetical protein BH10PSE6_BH10PSE6_14850 [soil metagenome]